MIVDTGPLLAYLDRREPEHARCSAFLVEAPGPLLVPQTVVAEVAHLAQKRLGPDSESLFLQDLADGTLLAEPVHPSDWMRITNLTWQYRDIGLGAVDASIVAMAERLGITKIATLDHRHFSAVRPAHVEAFELLP